MRTGTLRHVATLVFFHAHPDDEAIATGGTMARAVDDGHRVVLVVATHGEHGEPVPGVLEPGEELWRRRIEETHRSAEALGIERVAFLGFEDSGMMGEPTNDNPACFWQAHPDEAADRLVALLDEVGADVLTAYDAHGGYGHPDHIQVHRVGHLAAKRAGVALYEATMNRTHITELMAAANMELPDAVDAVAVDAVAGEVAVEPDFGTAAEDITHAIDVSAVIDRKRAAMRAHASQIGDDSFFMTMPDDVFAMAFGTEWYIRPGHSRSPGDGYIDDLLADLTGQ
jgi:LmbE family N-acetylglucosaminyl deacetylase